MDKKGIVIILGIILIVAGVAAMIYTEPAGEAGSSASFGIADVSEDIQPYFWHGIGLILVGVIVLVAGVTKF